MSILNINKTIHKLERKRDKLALRNRDKEFISTYQIATPNLNTGEYWDDKFRLDEALEEQDEMTKDKIATIASFIPDKNKKILDLGIGQGYLEQLLMRQGKTNSIYGVDISHVAIERLKKKFKGKFIVDNILNIDKRYDENYFDIIVAIEVIEHIPTNKIFNLYKKLHRLLKPGGLFIISTPLNEGLATMRNNPSAHVREYTIPILEKEFECAKFRIISTKTFFAFNKFYRIKKLLSALTKRWKPNNIVLVAVKK